MSESSDERSPGFNRKITGKLIAAGIFIVVGTGVVAYSMNYCRQCNQLVSASHDDHTHDEDAQTDQPDSLASTSLNLKSVSTQPSTTLKANPNTSFPNSTTESNGFNPGSNRVTTKRQSTVPPVSKSFSMPKVVKARTEFPAKQGNDFGAAQQVKSSNRPLQNKIKNPIQGAQETASNRFQQLKNNTSDFANKAVGSAKEKTNNLSSKTGNALRNFNSRAENATNNPTALKAPQGFAPRNNNSLNGNPAKPINSPTQSSLPPITPRAAFDTSKDLKPFAPANRPPVTQKNLPPIASRTTANAPDMQSNRRPTNLQAPAAFPQNTSVPWKAPTNSGVRTFGNQAANSIRRPTDAGLATLSTPGDRKLEGVQAPSVTIEKIAPREIQVNQPADFQLVVKNVGRIAANNVMVYDQIPAGTELIKSIPEPNRGQNNQISWELDTLNPGQEKRINIQLRPTRPGEIGSVAQVTFSAQASMRTKVTKPVLAIQHSTEPRVLIGDPVILNINVKNEGDGPATDVIIQEDLPPELEFSEGFRELEYAIGTLGPGQSKKLRLELRAAKIGKCRNILVAHAGGGLQTQHAVDVEVIAPRLEATGEGPTRRFLNRDATHRFAVRNSGTAPANNVELVCRLPSGLRFVGANNRGKYDENTHAVYWSLAELNAGLVANVDVTTKPTEPGNQDLKFEVVSDLDQSADTICKLNVEHLVDVFFDIDDLIDPIEIGSETAYKLRIENQGTKTATNVQLQVVFPSGIQPTSVEGNITNEIRGQQIAFQPITSMNPSDEIEIIIRGKGITAGDHRIEVNLMADGREINVSKQESTRVYSDR